MELIYRGSFPEYVLPNFSSLEHILPSYTYRIPIKTELRFYTLELKQTSIYIPQYPFNNRPNSLNQLYCTPVSAAASGYFPILPMSVCWSPESQFLSAYQRHWVRGFPSYFMLITSNTCVPQINFIPAFIDISLIAIPLSHPHERRVI